MITIYNYVNRWSNLLKPIHEVSISAASDKKGCHDVLYKRLQSGVDELNPEGMEITCWNGNHLLQYCGRMILGRMIFSDGGVGDFQGCKDLCFYEGERLKNLTWNNRMDLNMNTRKLMPVLAGLIFLGLAGCRTPSSALRSSLPQLDEGFHWEVFDEIEVAFPSPDGWHRAVSREEGLYTGSVSVENFEAEGLFKTGFTVQLLTDVKERTGHPASIWAIRMAQEIEKAGHNKVLAVDPFKESGQIRSGFVRFRNAPVLGDQITVHKFFVANDSGDRLYIFTFESPDETWEKAFHDYGTPMMEQITMKF